MTLAPLRWWRTARRHLPTRSDSRTARRLVARANAERDAGRFQAAAALYDEALAILPDQPRFLVQYGHLYKEAGDYAGAEGRYRQALALLPDDPDLAIQLGHLYKLGGRLDEAATHYARAAALRPGWTEAERELAGVRGAPPSAGVAGNTLLDPALLAPELAPIDLAPVGDVRREGFEVLRLGAARARTRGGFRRVLRGVEAIRGYVVLAAPLSELLLIVDDAVVRREPLQPHPLGGGQTKYVFNLWHDFSDLAEGIHEVELRVEPPLAPARRHRALLDVLPPRAEADWPDSDAVVDPAPPGMPLATAIAARPSSIRPAARTLLPRAPAAILVQRVDQLGDLAVSVPALRRLRALFPAARMIGLVTAGNAPLAATLGLFDELVVADFPEQAGQGRRTMDLPAQAALRARLAPYRFDLAIDLGETGGSRPLLLLSGARFLYGFKDRDFPWLGAGFELNSHDPGNGSEAAAHGRKLLAMVEALGALVASEPPSQGPGQADPAVAARYGLPRGARYILLHAGARLAYSRWPGFAELATRLLAETDLTVLLMGDDPLPDLPADPRAVVIRGILPFADFDALVAGAAAFVGNDSGPKHLAALRGVPTVSLHMARLNWNEWGQTGAGVIVSRRVPCAGCGIGTAGEECGRDFACIRDIRVSEVLAAVRRLTTA